MFSTAVAVKVTLPAKPFTEAAVIVATGVPPDATETVEVGAVSVKVGHEPLLTCTVTGVTTEFAVVVNPIAVIPAPFEPA